MRIVKWLDNVTPIPLWPLGHLFSFDDNTLPHKTLFSDKISKLDRYRCMAEYNWQIAFPPSIFEVDLPVPEVESSVSRIGISAMTSASSSSSVTSGGVHHLVQQSANHNSPCKFIFVDAQIYISFLCSLLQI